MAAAADLGPPDFVALGLYDPAAPDAPARLELIEFLLGLGATVEDLLEYRDELPGLASVLALRGGQERLTRTEVAAKAGVSEEFVARIQRVNGLPDGGPEARDYSEADVESLQLLQAAGELFGEEAVLQLARVAGSAMARVADAIVSAFLVNIQAPAMEHDPAGLALARANAEAAALLPAFTRSLDRLLRAHIIVSRRSRLLEDFRLTGQLGYETQELAVGFVDLVGSTRLSLNLPMKELGRALGEFEARAGDIVTDRGGRLVKLIGDEAMFVASTPEVACDMALDLAEAFADHPVLPPVRGGLAWGPVMSRDGDFYGATVNLAARVVKEARAGTVLVTEEVQAAAVARGGRHSFRRVHSRSLRGFSGRVRLFVLKRDAPMAPPR